MVSRTDKRRHRFVNEVQMNIVELRERLLEFRKKKNGMIHFSSSTGYNMRDHGRRMKEIDKQIAEVKKLISGKI